MPQPVERAAALNSARELGDWVRGELARETPDATHVLRVIARETDTWFRNEQSREQIAGLAVQSARTGEQRWDALIEGVVAFRLPPSHRRHDGATVVPGDPVG